MIIGVDAGVTDIDVADDLASALPGMVGLGAEVDEWVHTATHTVQISEPRFAVSLWWHESAPVPPESVWPVLSALAGGTLPGDPGLVATWAGAQDARTQGPETAVMGAWAAVTRVAAGVSGRVVRWPGAGRLVGPTTVSEMLSAGGMAEVEVIGEGSPAPDEVVVPGGFLRPRWRSVGAVLQVQRGRDGRLVPFESRTAPR
jgi:hypothetical protein